MAIYLVYDTVSLHFQNINRPVYASLQRIQNEHGPTKTELKLSNNPTLLNYFFSKESMMVIIFVIEHLKITL